MDTNNSFRKVLALLIAGFIAAVTFAQSANDGDGLTSVLGKTAESQEVKNLETNYKGQMVNDAHYLSKAGVELMFKDGKLNEINLYRGSQVYGAFTGKLPRGLVFGMSPNEVIKQLGKPSLEYGNSGYSEFDLTNYSVSCWYDADHLSQLSFSVK